MIPSDRITQLLLGFLTLLYLWFFWNFDASSATGVINRTWLGNQSLVATAKPEPKPTEQKSTEANKPSSTPASSTPSEPSKQTQKSDPVPKRSDTPTKTEPAPAQATPQRNTSTAPTTSTTPSTAGQAIQVPPARRTNIPKGVAQVSGFQGNVIINGKDMKGLMAVGAAINDLKTVETDRDSWVALELETGTIIAFPEVRYRLESGYFVLEKGKVFFDGTLTQFDQIISKDNVNISPGFVGDRLRFTAIAEPLKVRLFNVGYSQLVINAFGKSQAIATNIGSSVFLDRKLISQYDLGDPITFQKDGNNLISWPHSPRAVTYIGIVETEEMISGQLRPKKDVFFSVERNYNVKAQTNQYQLSIFAENNFGTWSGVKN